MLCLLPCTANSLDEVGLADLFAAREVTGSDLGIDLDPRVWWQEVLYGEEHVFKSSLIHLREIVTDLECHIASG